MVRRRVESTGFWRKSYAPSFMASTARSIEPIAVSTTTARFASRPEFSAESLVSRPMPSRRGIFRSVTTMAGFQACAFSQPSMPSRAVSVRYPHPEINSASPIRAWGSSSTIRTLTALSISAFGAGDRLRALPDAECKTAILVQLTFYHAPAPLCALHGRGDWGMTTSSSWVVPANALQSLIGIAPS